MGDKEISFPYVGIIVVDITINIWYYIYQFILFLGAARQPSLILKHVSPTRICWSIKFVSFWHALFGIYNLI